MSDGVVLLHGLGRGPGCMAVAAAALRRSGFKTLNLGYPSRRATVAANARALGPEVAAFAREVERVHFVGYSMGGLVARALITQSRPARLGAVVTMGTPHGGSEIVDLLQRNAAFRTFYGPAFPELSRAASAALNLQLGPVDYSLGAIAGTRALNVLAGIFVLPRPNDGTVSVEAAKVAGMADFRAVECDHFFLPRNGQAVALAVEFLTQGCFRLHS